MMSHGARRGSEGWGSRVAGVRRISGRRVAKVSVGTPPPRRCMHDGKLTPDQAIEAFCKFQGPINRWMQRAVRQSFDQRLDAETHI
jgi:hypothetical protein